MTTTFKTHDTAKNYRLTRDELRTHLVNSGDPFPDNPSGRGCAVNNPRGGTIMLSGDGFFWVRTRTLRIPRWEG